MHQEFGVHYYNCGDWVESCTALAEHHDGSFEIIRWTGQSMEAWREAAEDLPAAA
jgi:UDP-2,3-diacylglucosamine pyrophosphatase LpxH